MTAGARKGAPEANHRERNESGDSKLSEFIFDLNWGNYFPYTLSENERIELVNARTAQQFILDHQAETFEVEHWGERFFNEGPSMAKRRYYEKVGDNFLFINKGKPIGLVIGTLIDGTSYYLRYGMILKEFQSNGRIQNFVSYILKVLTDHQVNRVETDIAPSNLVNIHLFNKLQFNMTGLSLSERWGALIHFTKILNVSAENVFLDQFCAGTRPQKEKPQGKLIPLTKKQGGLP